MPACSGRSVVYSLWAMTTSRAPWAAMTGNNSGRWAVRRLRIQAASRIAGSLTRAEPRMGKPSKSMCFR
ncbi:MAG: hypothetical protein JXQ71_10185 [Verrucomicrobia bacterium]|nr:hypothetical protein [Verrucomicrobiota bacterium]